MIGIDQEATNVEAAGGVSEGTATRTRRRVQTTTTTTATPSPVPSALESISTSSRISIGRTGRSKTSNRRIGFRIYSLPVYIVLTLFIVITITGTVPPPHPPRMTSSDTATASETPAATKPTTTTMSPMNRTLSSSSLQSSSSSSSSSSQPEHRRYVYQLPQILFIGVPKSGSTAVSQWMFTGGGRRRDAVKGARGGRGAVVGRIQRPRVFTGEPSWYDKEVHFFDVPSRYANGVAFYSARFTNPNVKSRRRTTKTTTTTTTKMWMDACPDTFRYPHLVKETYDAASPSTSQSQKSQSSQSRSVKVIVTLRDPIERELSLYNHLVSMCLSKTIDVCYQERQKPSTVLKVVVDTTHVPSKNSSDDLTLAGRTATEDTDKNLHDRLDVKSFDEYVTSIVLPELEEAVKTMSAAPAALASDGSSDGQIEHHQQQQQQQPAFRPGGPSTTSLYAYYLTKWFEYFDRSSQILILNYDEVKTDPRQVQRRINDFLGTDIPLVDEFLVMNTHDLPTKDKRFGGRSKTRLHDVSNATIDELSRIFDPSNQLLYDLLERSKGPPMEQRPFPRFGRS